MDPARLFAAVAGMPLPDAAARIATGGVPVFPCVPGGKRPLVEHGFHEATAAARMRRLRSTRHARGGAVSHLLVRRKKVL